jgi:general secretion pathway protein M
MSVQSTWKPALGALKQIWAQRSPREQKLLRVSAVAFLLLALWRLTLAPAWQTWQEAPARQAHLDSQNQTMWQLKAQAQDLQKPKSMTRSESLQWLQTNVDDLGPGAKVSLQGERAVLSLDAAPAEALAYWISSAREHALAVPVQAQLQQSAAQAAKPHNANNPTAAETLWQGTVLLRLP